MNLVGKILTGLIALFSIVFMTLVLAVYATHQNWRTIAQDLEKKRDQLQKEKTDLETRRSELQKKYDYDQAAWAAAKLAEQEWRKTLQAQSDTQQKDLKKLEDERTTALNSLDTTQKNMTDVYAQLFGGKDKEGKQQKGLWEIVKETQQARNQAFNDFVAMKDRVQQLENVLSTLKARNITLVADERKYRDILLLNNMSLNLESYAKVAPAGLKGRVTRVGANGLVEIDVGADAGLRPGQQLQVYGASGLPYLGKLVVVKTESQVAVCEILRDFQKGPIQRNDNVAANLRPQ